MAATAMAEATLDQLLSAFQVDWQNVSRRLRTHPHEARTAVLGGPSSVLHVALRRRRTNYPPLQVVKRLLSIYPEAAWIGIESFSSPLHLICRCNPLADYLQILRAARPAVEQDKQALLYLWEYHVNVVGSEEGLVEFLTEGSREAARIYVELSQMIDYTRKCSLRPTRFALHTVAALTCDYDLLRSAISALPEQVSMRDDQGRYPVHAFLATRFAERTMTLGSDNMASKFRFPFDLLPLLRSLVMAFPSALTSRDNHGQLPLHVAIKAGWDDFDYLLLENPDSLEAIDLESGCVPFQLAAISPEASLDAVYSLLRRHPTVLRGQTKADKVWNQENDKKVEHATTAPAPPSTAVSEDLQRLLFQVGKAECAKLWKSLQRLLTEPDSMIHEKGLVHYLAGLPHCPRSLLQVMTHFHYTDLRALDHLGRLPLHWLVMVGHVEENDYVRQDDAEETCLYLERLAYLLQLDPAACLHRDHHGQLPLHLAVECLPLEGLHRLINACPRVLLVPDGPTNLPPALLAAQSRGLDEIFTLLVAEPNAIVQRIYTPSER